MGQKNRRDSRGRFAQPIVSPMNPEPNPPKLVSVSIKHQENNPPGVVIEETDISLKKGDINNFQTNQTFGQNIGEALDKALINSTEIITTNEQLTNKTKEVIMSEEVKKNEVVETTNNATTTEAAPMKETTKVTPQKKEEKKAEAAPAEAPAAPAKQEAPKKEETPIASGDTKGTAKQDLRKALQEQKPETASREVVIREEYDTGRAMLHNFGVGVAIGGGIVLGAALASGVVYLVKRQFGGNDEVTE